MTYGGVVCWCQSEDWSNWWPPLTASPLAPGLGVGWSQKRARDGGRLACFPLLGSGAFPSRGTPAGSSCKSRLPLLELHSKRSSDGWINYWVRTCMQVFTASIASSCGWIIGCTCTAPHASGCARWKTYSTGGETLEASWVLTRVTEAEWPQTRAKGYYWHGITPCDFCGSINQSSCCLSMATSCMQHCTTTVLVQ